MGVVESALCALAHSRWGFLLALSTHHIGHSPGDQVLPAALSNNCVIGFGRRYFTGGPGSVPRGAGHWWCARINACRVRHASVRHRTDVMLSGRVEIMSDP